MTDVAVRLASAARLVSAVRLSARRPRGGRSARLLGCVVVAVVPVVLGLLSLKLFLGASVADYLPIQTDELSYWHQISTFAHVGFANGYYSYQEQIPSAVSAYGAWGPVFPMLYGSLLAPIGVSTTSVVWLNIVVYIGLVTLGLALAHPSHRRMLMVAIVLATFTPALLYVPSGMEEPLHFALAVVLAALFHRLLIADAAHRRARLAWLVAAVTAGALLRPTWGLLLIPAALITLRDGPRRRGLWTVGCAVGAAGALGVLFSIWSAPYPYLGLGQMRRAPSVSAKVDLMLRNARHNLDTMLSWHDRVLQTNVSLRYELLLVLLALSAFLAWGWWRRSANRSMVAVVTTLALLLPFTLVIALYDIAPGTRVMGAHLMFAMVLLTLSSPRWMLVVPAMVVAVNIVAMGWFHQDFVAHEGINVHGERDTIALFGSTVVSHLRYQPGADRWCNTVLAATEYGFFYQLIGVPPGIGIGIDLSHDFTGPLKSGYVITTKIMIGHLPGRGQGLVPLVRTERGTLYRNLNSSCYPGQRP